MGCKKCLNLQMKWNDPLYTCDECVKKIQQSIKKQMEKYGKK